jgi:hypothetical protein
MSSYHRLEVNLHNALIQTNDKTPPYRVIDNTELYIDVYGGYYRFRVSLAEESRKALNDRDFNKFKRSYTYELITGDNIEVVAKGKVYRCANYATVHNRRVVRDHNEHVVVNELMHEAIGSLVLSNIDQYDSTSHEMKFFNATRMHTPYTSGAGKSGPINSARFQMRIPTGIDDLHAVRRFRTETTETGDTEIIGITTTWTYGEVVSDKAKILYNDIASVTQEAYDPRSFGFALGDVKVPPKLCRPATAAEVLEQFKKVVIPTIES